MIPELDAMYDLSPAYGAGVTYRRIRLTALEDRVLAELEDHAHAMRCTLVHDGVKIVAIEPDFHRVPMTTCAGARVPLEELIGVPLDAGPRAFFGNGRARMNCTHMLDLAWLAANQALRGPGVREYLAEIPDSQDDGFVARLRRDGAALIEWRGTAALIASPPKFAGRHIFRGLMSWAVETLDADMLEAVLVLQKTCLIISARRYVLRSGPLNVVEREQNVGVCHSFGIGNADRAERVNSLRDFSREPEKLLDFL